MMSIPHHIALYNGKAVTMEYISNPKDQFSRAAMRIHDNAQSGYVVTPKGEVFSVARSSRKAILVTGAERDSVLANLSQHI